MPDLTHTLQGSDLGFLRMVANAWGIELNAPDAYSALPMLVDGIRSRQLVLEVVEALPTEARGALQALLDSEGQLPWSQFARRFGEVRVMGAARRDRERPDLKPGCPSEMLWYRALIGKAFFDLPPEPQEYAYIPEDLLEYLQPLSSQGVQPMGRPASPAESAHLLPTSDAILDHTCTLLAALRLNLDPAGLDTTAWGIPLPVLKGLCSQLGLLDIEGLPQPDATRAFLESDRAQALADLARAWINSTSFNDLRLLPGLKFEGEWTNQPRQARQTVLEMLSHLPQTTWWSLTAFAAAVRERQPDFQRPAGDYDSWFIRREDSEAFLRGFAAWDEVDGALLRFILTGPLHWLGLMDLAASAPGEAPAAFRPSPWAAALSLGQPPKGLPVEDAQVHISAEGQFHLSNLAPRAVRYLLARFCQWEGEKDKEYIYRVTPASLERARQQGLRVTHLLNLMKRSSSGPLPPTLVQSLERWEQLGVQAGIEQVLLLRVASPDILAALQKTRAARYLGETLNPVTVVVKPGGEDHVRRALAELGYLTGSKLGV